MIKRGENKYRRNNILIFSVTNYTNQTYTFVTMKIEFMQDFLGAKQVIEILN